MKERDRHDPFVEIVTQWRFFSGVYVLRFRTYNTMTVVDGWVKVGRLFTDLRPVTPFHWSHLYFHLGTTGFGGSISGLPGRGTTKGHTKETILNPT